MTGLHQRLPKPPQVTRETLASCAADGDYRPPLFEWYKYVGMTTIIVAEISRTSLALRPVEPRSFAVLRGLLNRCSRLMLSCCHLFTEKKFGETTFLLDRAIVESSVWIRWLCQKDTPGRVQAYMADSLRSDLLLGREIRSRMNERADGPLPIESRMLTSIENTLAASGLSEAEVAATRLPRFAAACRDDLPPAEWTPTLCSFVTCAPSEAAAQRFS